VRCTPWWLLLPQGCSNGVVAVNLIRDLLVAHPNSTAVLLTTEVVSPAYYMGRDKARQVRQRPRDWGSRGGGGGPRGRAWSQ
jgi:hypothetical protein